MAAYLLFCERDNAPNKNQRTQPKPRLSCSKGPIRPTASRAKAPMHPNASQCASHSQAIHDRMFRNGASWDCLVAVLPSCMLEPLPAPACVAAIALPENHADMVHMIACCQAWLCQGHGLRRANFSHEAAVPALLRLRASTPVRLGVLWPRTHPESARVHRVIDGSRHQCCPWLIAKSKAGAVHSKSNLSDLSSRPPPFLAL